MIVLVASLGRNFEIDCDSFNEGAGPLVCMGEGKPVAVFRDWSSIRVVDAVRTDPEAVKIRQELYSHIVKEASAGRVTKTEGPQDG